MDPARPKPDARHAPSEEEFAAWCEHPVTRYVAAAWEAGATLQLWAWTDLFLEDDGDLERKRLELVTRADAYRAFTETTLSDYARILENA